MCCGNGYSGPSPQSLEFQRRYKPENSLGCCCGIEGDCSTGSKALEGSPLQLWEATHGKLVNVVTREIGEDGKFYQKIVRTACTLKNSSSRTGCCSLRYRTIR